MSPEETPEQAPEDPQTQELTPEDDPAPAWPDVTQEQTRSNDWERGIER